MCNYIVGAPTFWGLHENHRQEERTAACVQEEEQSRSLHSMADVRAARTEEKVGHSGRDDKKTNGSPMSELKLRPPTDPRAQARVSVPRRNWRRFERCAKLWGADAKRATADTWNFGLCATRSREPRQARKGATVPGKPSVPRRSRSSSL
jgi:hypothetical protein